VIFLLLAALTVLITPSNVEQRYKAEEAISIIPQDLLEMNMKDTPSIYLFMHDAFPHKDMAAELKLDYYDDLIDILKNNGFKIYDVYSLGHSTFKTMSSVFDMAMSAKDFTQMTTQVSGDNRVNLLLQAKDYQTAIAGGRYREGYDIKQFYNFKESEDKKNKVDMYVLLSIMKGRLNTMLVGDVASSDKGIRDFAITHKGENKLFIWEENGFPGHSTHVNSREKELKRWLSLYEDSVDDIKYEIELMIRNNPNSIIIFMSDHGPYLLEDGSVFYPNTPEEKITSIHFRNTYGAFMAIRWPDKKRAAKYDKEFNVTQDLFPIVLSYLYDSPIPLKYKIKDTAVRLKNHKFDKGKFYPNFYANEE
jgi:hypothetical protein